MTTRPLLMLITLFAAGAGHSEESPQCADLPKDLLEQSYADRKAVFEDATVAAKYGWRLHDAQFEAETGMGEYTFGQSKPIKVPLSYEDMIYQRTDVDANGKDEMAVFLTYLQGGEGRYRIDSQPILFCDTDNWRTSFCDGTAQNGGSRRRMQGLKAEARQPGFDEFWIKLDYTKTDASGGFGSYIYGAVFLPAKLLETVQNGPLVAEFSIPAMPTVVLTSLYTSNPDDPAQGETVFGAELFGIRPDGFIQIAFCTWSK